MAKHHTVIREQGKCSCGLRSHNQKKFSEHIKNRNKHPNEKGHESHKGPSTHSIKPH